MFQFCFVKKSSKGLCCIIKLPVGGKKKSEAKAGLSMIWSLFRDMTPEILPQVVPPYWKRVYYCFVYTNYYGMMVNRNVIKALRIGNLLTTVRKHDKFRGWTEARLNFVE